MAARSQQPLCMITLHLQSRTDKSRSTLFIASAQSQAILSTLGTMQAIGSLHAYQHLI
ncbi:uncharacterized protein K460DRAFT_368880 [Cucurbitaria berberidis CBS 394.84]|uniref:Uncharacterized protein n=1 Tax=Cucurbitaria berberidis CBS 394.84 TaxID=1168544 RepID=A0A9P4L6J5_9PLEO|nr:uncharacterized protein K460DRAFT_368880 [Cucurbitaria berberidis CBS 394.84]KAF1844011.1 hypothetical protein K460DRAFT_368880 [Cucurbitaria berberidis CBS 394.84]